MHHKLRISPLLSGANALFETHEINKRIETLLITDDDVIVNFNYDYYFLRNIFLRSKIITIINDNFWCNSLLGLDGNIKSSLRKTCAMSDCVLTVSKSLQEQILEMTGIVSERFLPWCEHDYIKPKEYQTRNVLLYWGYINDRIDFQYILNLARYIEVSKLDIIIRLIGPCDSAKLKRLKSIKCFQIQSAKTICELDVSDVFAAFLPYTDDDPVVEAIEVPNKLPRLASKGLPFLVKGMPNILLSDFVLELSGYVDTDIKKICYFRDNFRHLQNKISRYVKMHSGSKRMRQWEDIVKRVQTRGDR